MWKTLGGVGVGAGVGAGALFASGLRQEQAVAVPGDFGLEQSVDMLADAIREAGAFVQGHLWYGSEREQAEAYRHLTRILVAALEGSALSDPDFPDFRVIRPRTKSGMDNADQRYLSAVLDGTGHYRVFGTRGTSRRLDFTLYGEDELAPSIATIPSDALVVDADGRFEVWIGGEPRETNWMPSQPGPLRLLVRQIHSDWENETPGSVHVDRIDAGRPAVPRFDRATMAARLREATDAFATGVRRWPEMSRTRLHSFLPANELVPPRDTGSEGGLAGRLLAAAHFELRDDQALIVRTWPSDAKYQGIQLGHHWWESLDYANRQTSLTADQAHLGSDGRFHFVVSARDPGVPNWLDTEGFPRGVVMLRWDGLPVAELPDGQAPNAELVAFDAVRDALPQDEPVVSAEERAAAIAVRRAHVQRRFDF